MNLDLTGEDRKNGVEFMVFIVMLCIDCYSLLMKIFGSQSRRPPGLLMMIMTSLSDIE
jgi:hypothetical protein